MSETRRQEAALAHIHPGGISTQALGGSHRGELATLERLKQRLPDDYTVFHGVHWSREHGGWTQFGEIDFVVVNRSGKVLLVEQKNGGLEEGGEGLVKRYADSEKNVNAQIRRSVDKVREKFRRQHGRGRGLDLDYLIYCPDHRVVNVNAAALDMARIVDARAAAGLPDRIESVLGPGTTRRDGQLETVLGFFRQTFELVPDIHAHVQGQERAFRRQTGELGRLLDNLEMSPYRLRVAGTAGCGKSLLAAGFFERTLGEGGRPLLVCYNRPLAEQLKATLAGGHVNTWNGFCDAFLRSRGQALEYTRMASEPNFWQQVQERVIEETVPDDWRFDAIVVDEGQDFEEEWLEILKLFLAEDGRMLWLEDREQNLQDKTFVDTSAFVTYHCRRNYRSPESIARFIQATLPFEFEPANDLPGLGVAVHGFQDAGSQPDIVAKVVKGLMRRGFAQEEIVILSLRGRHTATFAGLDEVGGIPLRRFTGEYEGPDQVMTPGRLRFETIYRFKGQEAPAIILVDVDPDPERLGRALRLLFCGMTRATVRLEMLVNSDNPECARFTSVAAASCIAG